MASTIINHSCIPVVTPRLHPVVTLPIEAEPITQLEIAALLSLRNGRGSSRSRRVLRRSPFALALSLARPSKRASTLRSWPRHPVAPSHGAKLPSASAIVSTATARAKGTASAFCSPHTHPRPST